MQYQLLGIVLLFVGTCKTAPSETDDDGLSCYVSRGFESLEDLNRNKDNPENSKFCDFRFSKESACFAYAGFGNGETYPFDPNHGTVINKTSVVVNDTVPNINNVCDDSRFACTFKTGENDCVRSYDLCDGDNDCSDGSDERLDYCLNRWSTEEYGRFGCLGDSGRYSRELLADFFEQFYNYRKNYKEQKFSKGKGIINVSFPGSQLAATVSTDFLAAITSILKRDPIEIKADLFIKIEDITMKLKLTGDFASAYNAFEKFTSEDRPIWRLSFDEILDALDGCFGIIEQSIIGDLGAMYKKVSPFAKWVFLVLDHYTNRPNRSNKRPDWNSFRGDKINVEGTLKLDVGADNTADATFKGVITEVFEILLSKGPDGLLLALNGNIEFCEEEQKCHRLMVCGTDKCNTLTKMKPRKL